MIGPKDRIEEERKITGAHGGSKMDTFTIYVKPPSTFDMSDPQPSEFYTLIPSDTVIDGRNGKKYEFRWLKTGQSIEIGGLTVNIFLNYNNKRYQFSLVDGQFQATFDQILSTFKFL